MKRFFFAFTFIFIFIFMVSLAAVAFAQDTDQPVITETQETGAKAAKAEKSKDGTVPFTIGEIVVRDRAVPNIEDASTTTVIDGKDIERRGDRALSDSLTMVPGVLVYPTRKGFIGMSMRGFDHEKVAIMVDGIPYLDTFYGGNNLDLSSMPVQNVSEIIVNRGAASALYGALGSVGSVNIITKRPEKLVADAKMEYGEHRNWMINASAGAPIGDFYTWVTASVQNSNSYEISKKLTKSKRKAWFDKLVSYDVYGKDFNTITLPSVSAYLNDDNVWNHSSYRKYQASGRVGYNISSEMETGVSVQWASNEQYNNSFKDGSLASYNENTEKWEIPGNNTWTNTTGKSAFQNRAFYWPEDTRLTISPYFRADLGDLKIKLNTFYIRQVNCLEGYWTQDHSEGMPVTKGIQSGQSIIKENSFGFYLLPSYKIASWNTLSANLHFRMNSFGKYAKATSPTSPLAGQIGTGEKQVNDISASYFTLAVEDQMNFATPAGALALSLGISYDAQNYDEMRVINTTTYVLEDVPMVKKDSMIWGTRDSFNPVISAVLDPIANFLRLRSAFAIKTNFPAMDVYRDIGAIIKQEGAVSDVGINPETIYSYNGGFELFFMNQAISFRTDYFYTKIKDKIAKLYDREFEYDIYDNIGGFSVQGIEAIISGNSPRLANLVTLRGSLSYVFAHARNDEASPLTYGKEVTDVPQHQFIAQMVFDFISNTSCTLWGSYTLNQIQYVMASAPQTANVEPFSSKYYTTQKLHNPFMLNVKIQQELPFNTYVYIMCKNLLDDYNADPFNPGPGRMFYFGGGGRL